MNCFRLLKLFLDSGKPTVIISLALLDLFPNLLCISLAIFISALYNV
jgi:hypothetical protein